jgi:hypothetical protein
VAALGSYLYSLPEQTLPKTLAGGLVHAGSNAFNELGELLHLHLQVAGAGYGLADCLDLADLTLSKAAPVVVEMLPQSLAGALGSLLDDGPRFPLDRVLLNK